MRKKIRKQTFSLQWYQTGGGDTRGLATSPSRKDLAWLPAWCGQSGSVQPLVSSESTSTAECLLVPSRVSSQVVAKKSLEISEMGDILTRKSEFPSCGWRLSQTWIAVGLLPLLSATSPVVSWVFITKVYFQFSYPFSFCFQRTLQATIGNILRCLTDSQTSLACCYFMAFAHALSKSFTVHCTLKAMHSRPL